MDKSKLPEPKKYPVIPKVYQDYNNLSKMQKEFAALPAGYREFYQTLNRLKRENMDNYEWLLVYYEEAQNPKLKQQIKQQILKFEEQCPEETIYVKERRKREFGFYGRYIWP